MGVSGNGGKKMMKWRWWELVMVSDLENENLERGGVSGGLAWSRRYSGGKMVSVCMFEVNVFLFDWFENIGLGFKMSLLFVEVMMMFGKGMVGGEREAAATKIRVFEEKLAATEKECEEYECGCEELRVLNNELKCEFE